MPAAPAARAGDTTEAKHGSKPLGPGLGSAKVNIGGKPAWRAGIDVHACPKIDPPNKPHGAGTVLIANGSSKVFIEGSPAVRKGDKITEIGGGLNEIAEGCSKVQIGG